MLNVLPQWRKTMISDQALQEFKMIWKDETGQDMTDKEALDAAVALLHLFDVIYRPIPKAWNDEYENQHQTNGTA
jgi:hypothetical protein